MEPNSIHKRIVGMMGSACITEEVDLQDMILPKFSRTLCISDSFTCYVMDNDSAYDAIMGRDFLIAISIDVLHSSQESKWMDIRLPLRRRYSIDDPFDLHTACLEVLSADVDELEPFSIMEAK